MIRRSLLAGAVALMVVPAVAGCEAGPDAPTLQFHNAAAGATATPSGDDAITVSNAFVLAAPSGSSLPAGSSAGLFLGLFNNAIGSDTLTNVELPNGGAASVSITGGSVTVPGNSGVNLTGPTPQIVLNGLTAPLSGGQDIEVQLDFQNAGPIKLDVPVEPQSYYYAPLSQPPTATATPSASASATAPGTKASVSPSTSASASSTPTATATPTK